MAKVITVSQKFLSDHPRAGEPTYFVEKILNSLGIDYHNEDYFRWLIDYNKVGFFDGRYGVIKSFYDNTSPEIQQSKLEKPHTIRAGHRFKEGEMVSLRVWSDRPRHSPQIIFAPDVEVKKVYDFEIDAFKFSINKSFFYKQHASTFHSHMEMLCENDGLSFGDFLAWFKVPTKFNGQIICWGEVNYGK